MHGFTPRPVNQNAVQGEEASRGITNNSARQRRRRGEMCRDSAQRVAEDYDDEDDDMMKMMWISVESETIVHDIAHVYYTLPYCNALTS